MTAHVERLAVLDAGRAAQRGREDPVRRSGAKRIAAAEPDLERLAAIVDPLAELVPHPRLADARGPGHEHRARHRLGDALVIEPDEHAELAVAADTRRRLAEQRARARERVVLGDDIEPGAVAADLEARVEESRRHVVDAHAEAGDAEQARRAIDRLADRPATGHHRATGGERDRRGRRDHLERERAARSLCGLIAGGAGTEHRDDVRAVDESLERAAVCRRAIAQRAQHVRVATAALRGRRRRDAHVGLGDRVERALAAADQDDAQDLALVARQRRTLARRPIDDGVERAEMTEQRRELAAVGRTLLGSLGEAAREQVVEIARQLGPQLAEPRRLVEQDLREHRHHMIAGERRRAGQRLEQHAAEREHVRARADVAIASRLLRRHVAGRADHDAGARRELVTVGRSARRRSRGP